MSKLIVIDDNPMEHLIMRKIFDRHKLFHEATYATDGQMIIDFLAENCQHTAALPDIIFLDLQMPCLSGFDFLEQFERLYLSFQKPISIYVVSSSIDKNDKRRADAYPFVREFLIKPIEKDKLQQIHANYLN